MITAEIKEKINQLQESLSSNIGVIFGKKTKDNKFTGEHGFVFLVEKKKPLSELKPDEILPNSIQVGNTNHVTDVVQVGKIVALACDPVLQSSCYTWQTAPTPNDAFQRPLQGGLGIISNSNAGFVGTLGAVCKDSITGALIAITNNHVVVSDAFYTAYRNPFGLIANEVNDHVYQPAGAVGNPTYDIGRVLRYQPLHASIGGMNYIDAAVISVNSSVIDEAESYKQFGITGYTGYLDFATTAEIDNLLTTDPVLISSGRTTGVKEFPPCTLRVAGIGYIGYVGYHLQGNLIGARFDDCITIVREDPECPYPIAGGDSGSALLADFGGTYKIIGLVFAGANDGSYGVACRIDRIAADLLIQPWITNDPVVYIDPNSIKTITAERNTQTTIECDGQTYWQVGLTMYTNPCPTTTTTTTTIP